MASLPWVNAHCDGGARGNPGPAGYGAVLTDDDGVVLAELSEFVGHKTNNYAEYSGLLGVLQWALDHEYRKVRVTSDSELMVKQIQGKYKVNSPDLKPLWEEAKWRISKLDSFSIQHALRHKNKAADKLANAAMDRGTKDPSIAIDFSSSLPRPVPVRPPGLVASFTPAKKGAVKPAPAPEPVKLIPEPESAPLPAPDPIKPVEPPPGSKVEAAKAAPTVEEPATKAPEPETRRAKAPEPKVAQTRTPESKAPERKARTLRGVSKDGVVHILSGGRLSNGTFVTITVDLD